MPATDWGWLVTADELESWILHHDGDLLVVNKPGRVVCHPSKHGPWSSLVGAAREYLGADRLHMPSRLDRETSGVVVLAKTPAMGSRLQVAIQRGRARKSYLAILDGRLPEPVTIDQPLGRDPSSAVFLRQWVVPGGQPSITEFIPLACAGGMTMARVRPRTGRLHQIRVHAAWLGCPVAGDKLYGPDERLFLEFIRHGWTQHLAAALPIERQALHAEEISFHLPSGDLTFRAPLAPDMEALWASRMSFE
jgi:23S rRNA pseudouridine1911/1915/1917 synthase